MSASPTLLRRLQSSTIHRCLCAKQRTTHLLPFFTKSISKLNPRLRRFSFTPNRPSIAIRPKPESPLGGLANAFARRQQEIRNAAEEKRARQFFPEATSPVVGYWLLGSAGLVFGIVVLGGLTRLTESGLSITEWKPVTGTIPPLTPQEWESAFSKYRDSPEYRILNPHMTLQEYKPIYYMEWGHRLWGRVIGLSFVLPALYFVSRRRVSARMSARIAGISALIAFQGGIGWWMVKSGIRDDLFQDPGAHPRVSQYRLTAHLAAAFAVYAAMLCNGLAVLREDRLLKNPHLALAELAARAHPRVRVFRRAVTVVAGMVFVTAMSGGIVAGLDAGLIYNEFPKMGEGIVPPRAEMFNAHYARRDDRRDLWWRNMLENPTTAQFDHRLLATTTFSLITGLYAYSTRPGVATMLSQQAKNAVRAVMAMAVAQVTMGIGTLVWLVPIPLAVGHQAGSIALLTATLVLGSRVSAGRGIVGILRRRVDTMAMAGRGGRP